MKLAALIAASALVACATPPEPPTGRLYHYVRSNHDGSLPEQIYVYRASATALEVGKMVERCTNAAFVTAELDLARGQPRQLIGGRLARDGSQTPFAWLTYDPAAHSLHARVPPMGIDQEVAIDGEPWIIYDFDLSEITALNEGRPPARRDFSFAVALIWPQENTSELFRNLGFAHARYSGVERRNNRDTVRFDVSGGLTGSLWLDANEGFVVEAMFDQPNHTEYENFRLVLQDVANDGAARWRAVRQAHWEGCPEDSEN